MISALVGLLVVAALVVTARNAAGRGQRQGVGTAVRRFFQFGLQFGLVVVVASGLSILIARPLQRGVLATGNDADLARGLSFSLVGIPLLWAIARWTRRRIAEDPRESTSFGWAVYLTVAEMTSLAVASLALQDSLAWVLRARDFDAGAFARTLVWGLLWVLHRRITAATTPAGIVRDHQYAGAAFGMWSAGISLASLVTVSFRSLSALSSDALVTTQDHPATQAAIGVLIGAGVWYVYWVRTAQRAERSQHWHAYVLLVGVGAGLVVAIVSASTVLYDTLVWFLGTPDSPDRATHFASSVDAVGPFVAGAVIWWYHRTLLHEARAATRDEARRVYEYLVAFIALLAASAGCMILLVALLEAATASTQLAGPGAGNTLLLAATLLIVGVPMWWWFWRRIGRARRSEAAAETSSPTRRIYLFLLFGAVGVAAVVAMLAAVYLLFDDLVSGVFGLVTLRSMRWGLAILVTAAVVAQYHWRIYRGDRAVELPPTGGPHYVLLAGAPDRALAKEVALHMGGQVQAWTGSGDPDCWTVAAVMTALSSVDADEVVVVADGQALRGIAIRR